MRALPMPVFVVVGEQDAPLVEPSRAMAATIPGATIAVIPGAGHSPQFENAGAWFAALDGFLASLPSEPAQARS
jgi:pimeloyl-ACP methyl ester carboxylesterase